MFRNFTKQPAANLQKANVTDLAAAKSKLALDERSAQERELIKRLELKSRLHDALLDRLNLAVIDKVEPEELRREVSAQVNLVLTAENNPVRADEFKRIVDELMDEVLGFGPLEPLLADPSINDILVNGHKNVFVERNGVLERSVARFRDEKHLLRIIDKIVSRIGRRVDESTPWEIGRAHV